MKLSDLIEMLKKELEKHPEYKDKEVYIYIPDYGCCYVDKIKVPYNDRTGRYLELDGETK